MVVVIIDMHMVGNHDAISNSYVIDTAYNGVLIYAAMMANLNFSISLGFQCAIDFATVTDLDIPRPIRFAVGNAGKIQALPYNSVVPEQAVFIVLFDPLRNIPEPAKEPSGTFFQFHWYIIRSLTVFLSAG